MIKKTKIIWDFALNIISSALPLIVLQLIILPILARNVESEYIYGSMITQIGLITIFSQTFGGALNNVRLLLEAEYKQTKSNGDFNLLLVISLPLCILSTGVAVCLYEPDVTIISLLLRIFASVLSMLVGYYSVEFRLSINYTRVFISNIYQVIGFILGIILYNFIPYWEFIYIFGNGFGIWYIFRHTALYKEPYVFTDIIKLTSNKWVVLVIASFLSGTTIYIDRLLLFPALGGEAVSIYYTASLFGKIISMAIGPIASVMLSYFSQVKSISQRSISQIIIITISLGVVGYLTCIIIAPILLKLLYPQWAENALQYIYVTTFTAVLSFACSAIHPIVMKFRKIAWQIFLPFTNIVVYAVIALGLLRKFGLIGFCWGTAIAMGIKLFMMLCICITPSRNQVSD